MSITPDSIADTPRPRAKRRARWTIGGALLVLLIVQSITFTPAIHGRVVDEQTQAPLADTTVAALWTLDGLTLDSPAPGGPVKVAETTTNGAGVFNFPMAVLLHRPLLPFSWFTRSAEKMPLLTVAKQGYQVRIAANDTFGIDGPAHGAGFLSVRSSSLENALVRMTRWSEEDRPANDRRLRALEQVTTLESQCLRRWLCQAQPLHLTRGLLTRLSPDTESEIKLIR